MIVCKRCGSNELVNDRSLGGRLVCRKCGGVDFQKNYFPFVRQSASANSAFSGGPRGPLKTTLAFAALSLALLWAGSTIYKKVYHQEPGLGTGASGRIGRVAENLLPKQLTFDEIKNCWDALIFVQQNKWFLSYYANFAVSQPEWLPLGQIVEIPDRKKYIYGLTRDMQKDGFRILKNSSKRMYFAFVQSDFVLYERYRSFINGVTCASSDDERCMENSQRLAHSFFNGNASAFKEILGLFSNSESFPISQVMGNPIKCSYVGLPSYMFSKGVNGGYNISVQLTKTTDGSVSLDQFPGWNVDHGYRPPDDPD